MNTQISMYSSTSYTHKNAKIPWDPSWTLKKERKMFSNLRQRNFGTRFFLKSQRIFWYLWRRNQHNIYCLHLGSYVSKALEVDFVSLFPVPCLILIFARPYFFLVLKESTCLHNGNISWQLERERKALAANWLTLIKMRSKSCQAGIGVALKIHFKNKICKIILD